MRKTDRMIEASVTSWFKQLEDSKSLKKMPRENKPYVTISRESGAYGTTIAEMLVDYLSKRERRHDAVWAVFDKELINRVIDENKLPEEYRQYFGEAAMPVIQNLMGEILGAHPPHETLIRNMSEIIYNLASLGYVIIIGRGGNIITRSIPKGVHIRLVGSLEKRIEHMKEHLGVGEKEAKDYIGREDRDRRDYIKKYFNRDIDDVYLYDLVINLDNVPLEDAVRAIGEMVLKGKGKIQPA
ncbi:MAG: cytidylate kinase-like family protein [Deltaproteobacteria bacterium]|nr:cytidylate kinase-like family protein [Deltaproteobacteria bacterium]